jgi:hypothetical protein
VWNTLAASSMPHICCTCQQGCCQQRDQTQTHYELFVCEYICLLPWLRN